MGLGYSQFALVPSTKVWAGSTAFSLYTMVQGICFATDEQMCIRVCLGRGLQALQWPKGWLTPVVRGMVTKNLKGGERKNQVAFPLFPTHANDTGFRGDTLEGCKQHARSGHLAPTPTSSQPVTEMPISSSGLPLAIAGNGGIQPSQGTPGLHLTFHDTSSLGGRRW